MTKTICEKVTKIKVTGAQRKTYWYADKIGEVFEVSGIMRVEGFYVKYDGEDRAHIVGFSDAEAVEIRHEGARYRLESQKAEVGEKIVVVDFGKKEHHFGSPNAKDGDVFTVTSVDRDGDIAYVEEKNLGITTIYLSEYRVLTPLSSEEKSPLTATVNVDLGNSTKIIEMLTSLSTEVVVLKREVAELRDRMRPVNVEPHGPNTTPKTPQQIRDEIVEKAKCDVAELLRIGRSDDARLDSTCSKFYGEWFDVDFLVNSDKRTVVALVFELNGFRATPYPRKSNKPTAKGIAKCAPNDCFNGFIGKAIAIRRALGLEIPTEYLSVPNPTEVRVGDVVQAVNWPHKGVGGVVESVRESGYAHANKGLTFSNAEYQRKNGFQLCWAYIHNCEIIDDTRESTVA